QLGLGQSTLDTGRRQALGDGRHFRSLVPGALRHAVSPSGPLCNNPLTIATKWCNCQRIVANEAVRKGPSAWLGKHQGAEAGVVRPEGRSLGTDPVGGLTALPGSTSRKARNHRGAPGTPIMGFRVAAQCADPRSTLM